MVSFVKYCCMFFTGSGAHGILNQVLLMKSIENLKRWPSDSKSNSLTSSRRANNVNMRSATLG